MAENDKQAEEANLGANRNQELPTFDEIAALAFYIWEKNGSKSDDVEDWMEAKRQLDAKYRKTSEPHEPNEPFISE